MLSKVHSNPGSGYFTQAAAEYAKQARPGQEKKESASGKTIGEFSQKEWKRLLGKVDASIEAYQEDLKKREREALEEKQGPKGQQEYEAAVRWGNTARNMRFEKMNSDLISDKKAQGNTAEILKTIPDEIREKAVQRLVGNRAPYSALADREGNVAYNGVTFQCDYEKNALCLGDVSNPDNCLNIPLEKGGSLIVNRDNIDGLVQAIGMFSPADINRIMQAIAKDAKVRQIKLQIEDETSGEQVLEKEEEKAGKPDGSAAAKAPAGNPVLEGAGTASSGGQEKTEAEKEKSNALQEQKIKAGQEKNNALQQQKIKAGQEKGNTSQKQQEQVQEE